MASVTLILSSSDAERAKIIAKIRSQLPPGPRAKYEVGSMAFSKILEELISPDIFTPARLLIIDKVELLKKDDVQALSALLPTFAADVHILLSGSSMKNKPDCKLFKVFDFTDEKPWDRPQRIKLWLQEEAKALSKTLAPAALNLLFDQAGPDFGILQQEVFKISCYIGDRPQIELKDVQAIASSYQAPTGWQLAEGLIWEGKTDGDFDISLIGQLRYHLQLGVQIASLLEKKASAQEILSAVPSLKPKALEKYLPIVQKRGFSFFSRGLTALFSCEVSCKNSSIPVTVLFTRFKAELYQ